MKRRKGVEVVRKSYQNKELLHQKYWVEKLSLAQIAKIYNVSHKHILYWMKRFNIRRRTLSDSHSGCLNGMWERTHTKEAKRIMALSRIGKKLSKEHKEKISLKTKGRKNPRWNGGKCKRSDGYVMIWKPGHPFVMYNKYIFEHRLVMEKHLGRYLAPEELVHHKNGIRDDNRIENLELFESNNRHLNYHKKLLKEERK